MESFSFQILYQKNTHVGFEISIEFTKKLILIFQMSSQEKSFKEITFGVPFVQNTKRTFFHFFNAFNF